MMRFSLENLSPAIGKGQKLACVFLQTVICLSEGGLKRVFGSANGSEADINGE